MAIKIWEKPDSPELSGESYVSRHGVAGTTDPSTVRNYAIGATPAIVTIDTGILYRNDVEVSPVGWNLWDAVVSYGPDPSSNGGTAAGGSISWSFDTTGGTVRVRTSRQTVNSYPGGAPDYDGAIDVQDGKAEGVDITIPALKINVSVDHPLGILTLWQAKQLAAMTGKVNSAPFLTFAAGEVLFLGASGSDGTQAAVNVSYQFACSANQTGLTIGSITNIAKAGWDVIWVAFKSDTSSDHVVRQPEFAYVERVYETANFAAVLGFG